MYRKLGNFCCNFSVRLTSYGNILTWKLCNIAFVRYYYYCIVNFCVARRTSTRRKERKARASAIKLVGHSTTPLCLTILQSQEELTYRGSNCHVCQEL